jgi:hypothetical protein
MEEASALVFYCYDCLGYSCYIETPIVVSDIPSSFYDNWLALVLLDVLVLVTVITLCIWYTSKRKD